MLKGKQKNLDKNKDGKITGEDFKMMKAKYGKMTKANKGKMVLTPDGKMSEDKYSKYVRSIKLAEPKDIRDYKKNKVTKKSMGGEMKSTQGYGAARTSGMGLQDEDLIPGKSMDYYKDLM